MAIGRRPTSRPSIAWFVIRNHQLRAHALRLQRAPAPLVLNFLRFADRIGHLLRPNDPHHRPAQHRRALRPLQRLLRPLAGSSRMMYSAAKWERADAHDLPLEAAAARQERRPLPPPAPPALRPRARDRHRLGRLVASMPPRTYGCRVTTVTISRQQHDLAVQPHRRRRPLRPHRGAACSDYRDITGSFDKIVSIEMLEAARSSDTCPTYAGAACDRLLKPGRPARPPVHHRARIHRYDASCVRGVDFIQKHIFPGSLLLSVNRLNDLLAQRKAAISSSTPSMTSAAITRKHAAALARQLRRPSSTRCAPSASTTASSASGTYYLCYCEAAFALRHISVVHTLHSRANNLSL